MKTFYKLNFKYIGKRHCDRSGCINLTDKLPQRVLKQLFDKGNKFVTKEIK